MLSEINIAPRILTNFTGVMPSQFKKDLDSYLKTRSPVTFLSELRSNLQVRSMLTCLSLTKKKLCTIYMFIHDFCFYSFICLFLRCQMSRGTDTTSSWSMLWFCMWELRPSLTSTTRAAPPPWAPSLTLHTWTFSRTWLWTWILRVRKWQNKSLWLVEVIFFCSQLSKWMWRKTINTLWIYVCHVDIGSITIASTFIGGDSCTVVVFPKMTKGCDLQT